jgi:hypothetical protein
MSAYGPPAAAGPHTTVNATPDRRDWLRLLGGLLFAAGAAALAFRKTSDWSDWAIFFVFFVATAVLYGLAGSAARALPVLQSWESAYYVFAIILLPITLGLLVTAIDDSADGRLNAFWIFAVSAAVAALTALRRGAWWQMLIAGIYAIVSWIALWSKILDNPSADTIRWLLIAFAALLLVAAAALARDDRRPHAADLITAAGIAAVLAGAIGLAGLSGGASGISGLVSDSTPKPTQAWNVYLLIVSLALIAYGARSVTRGPGYVGGIGFTVFILLVGTNVVARLKGDEADAIVGWPLILLLVGLALLVASFVMPRTGAGTGSGPGAPPPPPGAVSPGQAGQQGGGLLDQWRTQPPPPPPGQQPPQQ